MNTKGNLLNGSLLGTSSKTAKIFIKAVQYSQASVTAVLRAGRYLKQSSGVSGVSTSTLLSAGRKLQATGNLVGSFTARMATMAAVQLSAVVSNITLVTSGLLTKLHPVNLVGTSTPSNPTTAQLRWIHPVELMGTTLPTVTTAAVVKCFVTMKASSTCTVNVVSVLSEISRIRAPNQRIAFISNVSRTAVIPES